MNVIGGIIDTAVFTEEELTQIEEVFCLLKLEVRRPLNYTLTTDNYERQITWRPGGVIELSEGVR